MTAPGPAPRDTAPVGVIRDWCNQADAHFQSLGLGFPPDIGLRLTIRALGAAMGVDPDELDTRIEIERLRFLAVALEQAEQAAARAKLLGGIQLPPNMNGQQR